MEPGCLPLYSAEQTRELDRMAIEEQGIPGYTLMSRAGEAAFRVLQTRWPSARRVYVLCGGGNNAGDGYVVARLARAAGMNVAVGWLVGPERLKADAGQAWQDACDADVPMTAFEAGQLERQDVIVDALLGTGLEREVTGDWAEAINAVNATGLPVLALDIPSGVSADSGRILGTAIRAAATVTFIGRKLGLCTGAAPDCAGHIHFDDLQLPVHVYAGSEPVAHLLTRGYPAQHLPVRSRTAHKGHFGHVLVVGGQPGMGGAVRLAGEAAARAGAGLVSVATAPGHGAAITGDRPELMVSEVDLADDLEPLLERAGVVAAGPGLGQSDWSRGLFERLCRSDKPLVLDADALNLLVQSPRRRDDWILTPHPGEAARLLACSTQAIQEDRCAAVRELQQRYGGVVVLKGAGTLIYGGDCLLLSATGNPGMASGGMGDVLTGLVAGLLAQALTPVAAAATAVHVHGAAADQAAGAGERGLLASDVLDALRPLVNPNHAPAD